MANYKIKNITNSLDKRNPNFNIILDLDYVDNMLKKTIKIKPNQEVVMSLGLIPQNINHLRMNKMIIIEEINDFQVQKICTNQNSIQVNQVSSNIKVKN